MSYNIYRLQFFKTTRTRYICILLQRLFMSWLGHCYLNSASSATKLLQEQMFDVSGAAHAISVFPPLKVETYIDVDTPT